MQADIVELPHQRERKDDDDFREALIAGVDPKEIDASNAAGVRLCVEAIGHGPDGSADYLRRWLGDRTITAARVRRWMSGEGQPNLRQARALFLLAVSSAGKISAHFSRLALVGVLLAPFLQHVADDLT